MVITMLIVILLAHSSWFSTSHLLTPLLLLLSSSSCHQEPIQLRTSRDLLRKMVLIRTNIFIRLPWAKVRMLLPSTSLRSVTRRVTGLCY